MKPYPHHDQVEAHAGVDEARALRLLEKAERACPITRSLACPTALHAGIETDGAA